MKLISNTGDDRVLSELLNGSDEIESLDVASSGLSVFALAELLAGLEQWRSGRLVFPDPSVVNLLGERKKDRSGIS